MNKEKEDGPELNELNDDDETVDYSDSSMGRSPRKCPLGIGFVDWESIPEHRNPGGSVGDIDPSFAMPAALI